MGNRPNGPGHFIVFAATFFALLIPEMIARPVADLVVVRMEIERGSAVLHEPVYATLVVQNTQPERLDFDLGANSKTTFAFSITQPDGRVMHIPPFLTPDGVSAIGRVRLENGLTYTQKILLNEWHDFASAGQYSIEFRTSAAFRTSSGRSVETTAIQPIILEVQQRDEKRLQSICNELVTTALTLSFDARKRTTAAVALSYVRDPVAIPFLLQLLEHGSIVGADGYAVEGLTRIGTNEAIGALIETVGVARYGSSHSQIVSALGIVRTQTKDEELKRRIDAVLRPKELIP